MVGTPIRKEIAYFSAYSRQVRGKVEKDKHGRVEQSKHDHVVFADAVRAERVSKTVDLAVQLAVGPAAVRMRIKYGGTVSETRNIAQKTVQIGETGFKCVAEHGNIIGIFVTQGITS